MKSEFTTKQIRDFILEERAYVNDEDGNEIRNTFRVNLYDVQLSLTDPSNLVDNGELAEMV